MLMRTTPLHVAAAVAILAIAACRDYEPVASTNPIEEATQRVVLSVNADTVLEGTSKPISARVVDQRGKELLVPVSWSTSDPAIASVNRGQIIGVSAGAATIIASTGSAADTAYVIVTPLDQVLDVQPSAAVVVLGDTINFIATVRDRNGNVVPLSQATWNSSDTVAAKFVNGGKLVAKAEGELSVSAQSAYRQGTGTVRVFKAPVASVTISPSTANVYQGAKLELDVVLRDQPGRVVQGEITFGSSDYSKATVNQDGIVTGVAPGTVVITATSERKTGSATITVLGTPAKSVTLSVPDTVPVGVEVPISATPLDATGAQLTGRTFTFQSANPSVATVNNLTKTVKGIADGSTTISVIVDGVIASDRISVGGRRPTSISITPTSLSINAGQQAQMTAKVLDQVGTEMVGQSIQWSSSNTSTGQVSATGVVSAIAVGSSTILAVSGGLSASAAVSVVNAPVASVRISPSTVSTVVGAGAVTLTATALDGNGVVLPGRASTWASQNPTVASVSSLGVLTAVGPGTTSVTATIEGKTASITVAVGTAPLAPVSSVTVTLASAALNAGQQTQASAVLKDASGNTLSRTVTWSSLDTAVAKVSTTGLVTAYAGGTVAIMANSEGVSGSASLTVTTPAPTAVAKVILDAPTQSLTVGQTIQTVVTLNDAQNNILTGRTITYSTANPSIVSVSATGLIKGVGPGSAKVTATSGGISGSETFTVTAAVSSIASIAVTPATVSLAVGQTSQETAVAKDAQGNTISGTTFTWTTSNPAVATVSASGLVSASGTGNATISAVVAGITGSMSVSVTSTAAPPPPPPTDATGKILAVLGQTKTVTETAALGSTFATYDQLFNQYLPTSNTWGDNYYDRGVVYYARYVRTGDATFLNKGHAITLAYRQQYLEANNYAASPHWSLPRGLELHYRLTGDTLSRRAVVAMFAHALLPLSMSPAGGKADLENTQMSYMENRIQARVLQGALSSYRMGASYIRPDTYGGELSPATWPTRLRTILNQILSTQNANGSYSWIQICGGQLNYMVGMLNDVLIEYYRDFEADPRIPSAIERANEYLWTTQWSAGDQAFKYASVNCAPNQFGTMVGGTEPAGDLNGLMIASFGWLYQRTGDVKWKTRGDAIMSGLILQRWAGAYASSKQFNQAYAESYRYLGWR
jgi:trimeric autotransporter adhesin